MTSDAQQAVLLDAPDQRMDLPDGTNQTPAPMALLRRLMGSGATVKRTVIYFDSKRGIHGPGFGNDIPKLLSALGGVQRTLAQGAGGDDFFISMIPSRFLRFDSPNGPTVPDFAVVPDFKALFDPVCRILKDQVAVQCDIEINVEMEGRWNYSYQPRLSLSILQRESRQTVCARDFGIDLDEASEACQAVLTWFAGCEGGIIIWKPSNRPDAVAPMPLANEAVPDSLV